MRNSLLNMLVCPITKKVLNLYPIEQEKTKDNEFVCKTGILWSENGYWYPIINFVPIMLVFSTRLLQDFSISHIGCFKELPSNLRAPDKDPNRGELSTQKTFTEEWEGLSDDALSFTYDEDELLALHRDVWLKMSESEYCSKRTVLDVGCGYGKEAIILSKLFPKAQIVGVDMNLALISAGRRLVHETRVEPIVASLFYLPFQDGNFSYVHCQGVMHHTYSTKAAFDAVRLKVAATGSFFVWLYAKEDRHVVSGLRGFLVWLYWTLSHSFFRPLLSRSPAFFRNLIIHMISLTLHPILARRDRGGKKRWGYKNTVHGIRDAFTPRYAHEHGFNEVISWFEMAGFIPTLQSSQTYYNLFGSRLLGVGILGRPH